MFNSLFRFYSFQAKKSGPPSANAINKTSQTKKNLPIGFDPKKSKYSGLRVKQNLETLVQRADAPEYLKDE